MRRDKRIKLSIVPRPKLSDSELLLAISSIGGLREDIEAVIEDERRLSQNIRTDMSYAYWDMSRE